MLVDDDAGAPGVQIGVRVQQRAASLRHQKRNRKASASSQHPAREGPAVVVVVVVVAVVVVVEAQECGGCDGCERRIRKEKVSYAPHPIIRGQ